MVVLRPLRSIPAILNLTISVFYGCDRDGSKRFFMLEQVEIWKDVVGYEGYYQVSGYGIFRRIRYNCLGEIIFMAYPNGAIGANGYRHFSLGHDDKKKRTTKQMHRIMVDAFIGSYDKKLDIDHIDGNKLNNNIENLRICTRKQNSYNQKKTKVTTSKYRGVNRRPGYKKWITSIKKDYTRIYIGVFFTEEEAAKAYDEKARELFGEYGRYNFPQEGERGIN